jgi:hypothetical protein
MGFSPYSGGLALQATTGINGFALQNGTPNILSWTAPNDGLMHRVLVIGMLEVTSSETGGSIDVSCTSPDGTNRAFTSLFGANSGLSSSFVPEVLPFFVKAGTTITVFQNSALTAGASTLWLEIWGS